ncbi:hypothetical protein [Thermus sp. 93170]|uniref:hypothetical protein n=1 Tax=Thermus sp. 93170 TaxID=1046939 RepID=UPI003F439239
MWKGPVQVKHYKWWTARDELRVYGEDCGFSRVAVGGRVLDGEEYDISLAELFREELGLSEEDEVFVTDANGVRDFSAR